MNTWGEWIPPTIDVWWYLNIILAERVRDMIFFFCIRNIGKEWFVSLFSVVFLFFNSCCFLFCYFFLESSSSSKIRRKIKVNCSTTKCIQEKSFRVLPSSIGFSSVFQSYCGWFRILNVFMVSYQFNNALWRGQKFVRIRNIEIFRRIFIMIFLNIIIIHCFEFMHLLVCFHLNWIIIFIYIYMNYKAKRKQRTHIHLNNDNE